MVAGLSLAAASLTPVAVLAQEDDGCAYWHDEEADGPFTPP